MANNDKQVLATLARQGFRFKKELGQHFLFNTFLLEQIADCAALGPGDVVVEAGAGAGSLTAALAATGAKVVAVELDRALIPYLEQRFQGEAGVDIVRGDVLHMDIDGLVPDRAYKLCANLPYNITTAFVTQVFRRLQGVESGAILLQKESADKITAQPGQEGYGLLALSAAWFGEVEQVMAIGPDYFHPKPSVDSALITFRRRPQAYGADEEALWQIIRSVFNHRRKNILNCLKPMSSPTPVPGKTWADILEETGVDAQRRPETLSLAEYAAITIAAGYPDA